MPELVATDCQVPTWSRWTLACAAGETVGIAAAAALAGLSFAAVGEPSDSLGATVTLGLAALGGLVEGLAVGLFQHRVLHPWLPDLRRRRWVGVTVAVAVGGWLLGMLPPTLASVAGTGAADSGSAAQGPPAWVMPLAGLAAGLFAGAVFGAAQAWTLRGLVARPRRWVSANALGWALALAVIFTGASVPGGGWPLWALLTVGALTGVVAGLAIGAVTGLFLSSLDDSAPGGSTVLNKVVLGLLRSPAHRLLSGALVDLRYTGVRTGRRYALPVQYARVYGGLVVFPARPETKVWWRNLVAPADVEVGMAGVVGPATARTLTPANPGYAGAKAAYLSRWPRARMPADAVLVEVGLL